MCTPLTCHLQDRAVTPGRRSVAWLRFDFGFVAADLAAVRAALAVVREPGQGTVAAVAFEVAQAGHGRSRLSSCRYASSPRNRCRRAP